jgi:hypothetical protein
VHRYQLSRLGSEFASDGFSSDRLFGSSSIYFVGFVLAPRFFSQWLAQNISQQFASFATGKFGSNCDRRGGVFMQLKMWVLSGAALVLWLAPLVSLDKKVGWHKSAQGLSLIIAVSCAIGAGNIARKLAEENEIELIKSRAINADVVDEIAVSAYVSQQQRQQEAEAILSLQPERDEDEIIESLERALALKCVEPGEPTAEPLNQPDSNALTVDVERFTSLNLDKKQALELIQKLRTELNQTQVIEKLWECKKGGSETWKRAHAEFKKLTGQ